jgi:hypothetical protein
MKNYRNLKLLVGSALVLVCSLIGEQIFANPMNPTITITAMEPAGIQMSVAGPNITLSSLTGAGTESASFTILVSNIPGAPGIGGNAPQTEDSYYGLTENGTLSDVLVGLVFSYTADPNNVGNSVATIKGTFNMASAQGGIVNLGGPTAPVTPGMPQDLTSIFGGRPLNGLKLNVTITVPDGGSSAWMLGAALAGLSGLRRFRQ